MEKIISNNLSSKTIKILPIISAIVFLISATSCNKLLDTAPKYILTPEKIFSNNDSANYALAGLYGSMGDGATNSYQQAFLLDVPVASSFSADEAYPALGLANSYSHDYSNMYTYSMLPGSNFTVSNYYWEGFYNFIYQANSIIEGIQGSTGMTVPYKNQYMGEALFWRAYYYYYLVNFYGPVPLITTSDYEISSKIARTDTSAIYQQIVSDLTTADSLMSDDISANEVYRVTRSAVRSLLARVSLFTGNWADAEKYSTEVIGNGKYSLAPIGKVFYDGSSETILGISSLYGYAQIATQTLPSKSKSCVYAVMDSGTNNLVSAFSSNDLRTKNYISYQKNGSSDSIYIDYKYKINGSVQATDGHTESTVVLRLAEQYLIRAEAEAREGKLSAAIADINVVRQRAQATPLSNSSNSAEVINDVINERRLELCFEWADRWFTLKRTGIVDAVISAVKSEYWKSYAKLYPIPLKELQKNPSLTQNDGYDGVN
ncbi:hypothetical protein A9P82_13045 [Arachidicoccus ginsenosidimutans]|uniref:RagB/SusD family nutrient uptake outer membrane protein n=1 Tax=Arachidicoccus sp. BS20 TaxID=1850526 RepID=UPI0007F09B97|nr:RagB/SusD family nutrient uptake outer membrane protein [Arachidicoccus sp. BS20]ANI90129.1 hypothetical protein A9P82_13045 [Arachidicoccus sp. BS20]